MFRNTALAISACIALVLSFTTAQAALVISSTVPTMNVTCLNHVCTATAANAVLSKSSLQNQLAKANVTVVSGSVAGDIVVETSFSWVSAHRLTLDSYHSITVDQPVSVTGSGGLTLTTNDGGTGGALSFVNTGKVIFWSLSSGLTINGNAYALVNTIATLASNIASNPSGFYALARSYDASVDGTYSSSPIGTTFTGTFEGLGNAISKLHINDTSGSGGDVGLFAEVGTGGTLCDISLPNAGVTALDAELGPLVGVNIGTVMRASASGIAGVSDVNHLGAGGLVGWNNGTITQSHAATKVSGFLAGGLVAINAGPMIAQSFATGQVSGTGYAGGLVAEVAGGSVVNSYATGNVKATSNSAVGGFAGIIDDGAQIVTSYSAGEVIKGGHKGAFVGGISFDTTFTNCYWDTDTANTFEAVGNAKRIPGITGITTAQFQSEIPFGFDSSIWAESPSINGGLPYLKAVPPT